MTRPAATPVAPDGATGDDRHVAPLVPEGMFVIRLRGDCAPDARQMSGSIEHVMSGASERFRDLDALLGFMARHIAHRD